MKVLSISALILALSSGVAFADRHSGGGFRGVREAHENRGWVRENRGNWNGRVRENGGGNWGAGVRVEGNRGNNWGGGVRVEGNRGWEGRERWENNAWQGRAWQRPVIRERYYDYRYRPQVIVESWQPRYGYIWVEGSWSWCGTEWMWTPGHYAVDPECDMNMDMD